MDDILKKEIPTISIIFLYDPIGHTSEEYSVNNVKMKAAILRTEDDNRIELLQYFDPEGKKRDKILSNDIGVSHFAVTVSDIDYLYNKRKNYPVKFISPPTLSPDGFVKVAYAVLMEECLIEIVQVLDNRAKYTGGEVKK